MSCVDTEGIIEARREGKSVDEVAQMFMITADYVKKILKELAPELLPKVAEGEFEKRIRNLGLEPINKIDEKNRWLNAEEEVIKIVEEAKQDFPREEGYATCEAWADDVWKWFREKFGAAEQKP